MMNLYGAARGCTAQGTGTNKGATAFKHGVGDRRPNPQSPTCNIAWPGWASGRDFFWGLGGGLGRDGRAVYL